MRTNPRRGLGFTELRENRRRHGPRILRRGDRDADAFIARKTCSASRSSGACAISTFRSSGFARLRALLDTDAPCASACDLARDHLQVLRARIAELKAMEDTLEDFLSRSACVGGPARSCAAMKELSATTSL